METNCNCNCGLTKKYWHTSDKVENQFNYCGSKFYKTCTNRMFLSGTRGTWYWSKYHADTQLCCISVPHQWVSWSNQQNFPRSPSGPCKKISLPYYTVVDFINCLIIKHHNPPPDKPHTWMKIYVDNFQEKKYCCSGITVSLRVCK